jgi:hypothetical protein
MSTDVKIEGYNSQASPFDPPTMLAMLGMAATVG